MSFPVVFIGATKFGLRCFRELLRLPGIQVVGAITATRKFRISYRPAGVTNVMYADLGPTAAEAGVPLYVMREKMAEPELIAKLRVWSPALIVVAGWYHLVPREIRAMATVVGLHASLLPDYAGGAPLVWAMINGEKETGITLFAFDEGVDTGPIVGQLAEPIHEDDTIGTLYTRIEERGVELLRAHVPLIAQGRATFTPQDHSRRRVFPQRAPEDGRIDWAWPARRIYDFVRAQTRPYPGAFGELLGQRVTVWSASVTSNVRLPECSPGTLAGLTEDGEQLVIACGGGTALALREIAVDGRDMKAADWYRAASRLCAEK